MTQAVWTKFWFADYEADIELRLCSLAAQGLWMRMLCWMDRAEPRGYLNWNGQPLTEQDAVKAFSCSAEEFRTLSKELEIKGVFDRDSNGVIYSRRMVREEEVTEYRRRNGKMGGRPKTEQKPRSIAESKAEPKAKPKSDDEAKTKPLRSLRSLRKNTQIPTDNSANYPPESVAAERPPAPLELGFGDPAEGLDEDGLKRAVWREGRIILGKLTNAVPRSCGDMIGRLVKHAGQDYAGLLRALHRAYREKPMDPMAWLMASVGPTSARHVEAASKESAMAALRELDNADPPHENVPGPIIEGVSEEVA